MKKLFALLLVLSLLLSLPLSVSADGGRETECGNVMLTVTGCCTTPGADGAPRLTLFLSAGNKNDAPREINAEGCVIGSSRRAASSAPASCRSTSRCHWTPGRAGKPHW